MFRNRHFEVKLAKDGKSAAENGDVMNVNPKEIAEIATDTMLKAVVVIGGVVAANRVLKTICEIAVITAKAKIK